MRHKDFEDFLMNEFASGDGSHVLDDDLPEAFDDWLQGLEPDDFIKYGNKYAKEVNLLAPSTKSNETEETNGKNK